MIDAFTPPLDPPRIPLLQTAFRHKIAEFLEDDGTADPASHRSTISGIHSATVAAHLANRDENRVLRRPAPSISPAETTLPHHFRTTLSQLRSGQCSRLNSFRQAIGLADTALCPECCSAPHTTGHIFSCPAAPTNLLVEDLWHRPVEVARHLASLPAFASLPPLEVQEPRPSPEPPPRV